MQSNDVKKNQLLRNPDIYPSFEVLEAALIDAYMPFMSFNELISVGNFLHVKL